MPKPEWLVKKIINNVRRKKVEEELTEKRRLEDKNSSQQHQRGRKVPSSSCILVIDESLSSYTPFTSELSERFKLIGETDTDDCADEATDDPKHGYGVATQFPIDRFIAWSYVQNESFDPDNVVCTTVGVALMQNAEFLKEVLKSSDGLEFADARRFVEDKLEALNRGSHQWRVILAFTDLNVAICKAQKKVIDRMSHHPFPPLVICSALLLDRDSGQ